MLSLAPGNILRGTYWSYHILNLVKGDSTHISSLFKAEVMPHEKSHNTSKSSKWSIIYYGPKASIKGVSPDDLIAMVNLERELHAYRLPGVASS
ncbi:hypothetical protein N7455_006407 [Penicillium solitum]|uniref:uncharacterized protein n=1 Tax=Penicillium solitum TaxID=60172 RepID=UPI0032C4413A|nr:hypothetical protein N7536_009978 [Penicillium majusculum]KAJ5862339.1 hypothetical protein N7455_006407 [Penicillium solitum]